MDAAECMAGSPRPPNIRRAYARARACVMGLVPMTANRKQGDPATSKSERPRCGAKTRAGGRCKAPAVWNREEDEPRNGRCRIHGGHSTGPRTKEGLQRTLEAMQLGRVRRQAVRSLAEPAL